jgi:selenocysteine-specific elongation factor
VTLAQDQEEIRQKLEKIYLKSQLQPPYVKEWIKDFPGDSGSEVLEVMAKEGVLVKVTEELYFHRDAIERLEGNLIDFLNTNGEITMPQFKDLTGTSRKYAIPLMEYYDRNQVTVRVGDSRILRKK